MCGTSKNKKKLIYLLAQYAMNSDLVTVYKGACSSVVQRSPREQKVPSLSLHWGSGDVVGKHR